MEKREQKKFIYSGVVPVIFVFLLVLIKLFEEQQQLKLSTFGIFPRTIDGLKGILFAPLLHANWNHLYNNAIPLIILGWAIFYFYKTIALRLIIWSYLLAGLYTWISARSAFHLGASGLVYSLFGFLLISGFIRKHVPLISLSFLVAFLYGSLVWGIFPLDKSVSWEGHFWGLFVGLVLAYLYRKEGPQRKEFVWPEEDEEDEKDLLGDYVEFEEIKDKVKKQEVVYHFVPNKKPNSENDTEQ